MYVHTSEDMASEWETQMNLSSCKHSNMRSRLYRKHDVYKRALWNVKASEWKDVGEGVTYVSILIE